MQVLLHCNNVRNTRQEVEKSKDVVSIRGAGSKRLHSHFGDNDRTGMTDNSNNNPTIYYVVNKKDNKPVVHAVALCCGELEELHRAKVVEFVSQYDKGHEHLADLGNEMPPLHAIL